MFPQNPRWLTFPNLLSFEWRMLRKVNFGDIGICANRDKMKECVSINV